MRKWHRWISVFFGVFLLWMATTGVLSHVADLWPSGAQAAPPAPPAGFECPEGWRCSPPRDTSGIKGMIGLFHHLHSGETFGPLGTAISLLSGVALFFFSFSGLWMYIQMFRNRKKRNIKPGWFWK